MEQALEITVGPAEGAQDIAAVRALLWEYGTSLAFEVCFRDFEQELDNLPGPHVPPYGELLLCRVGGAPAGCVATCRYVPGVAEMKRLYVRPDFRDMKIGSNLAWLAMGIAHEAGYASMRLETLPQHMARAVGMYEKLGFEKSPSPPGTDPRIVCYTRTLADLV